MSYSNINRVILVGRITKDPELRETTTGRSVCTLRVACNGVKRDEDGGFQERPNFFDVTAFSGLAETVSRYMGKGRRIAVDGRLEWREWETPEQERRQTVGIVAEHIEFLDGPADGREPGANGGSEPDLGDGELVGVGAGEEVPF